MPIPVTAPPSPPPGPGSVQFMIDTCKSRYLLGGAKEQRNRLAANYTAGATTLAFAFPTDGIDAGSRLGIGLNTFYVWSVDSVAQTATVTGGDSGSVDTDATVGDVVIVNPRYTDSEIFNAINEEILDLGSPATGLFQVKSVTLTYNAARIGYDLTGVTDMNSILEVRLDMPDTFGANPRTTLYRLERNSDTDDYASGLSLKLGDGFPGRDVEVLYKAPFTTYTSVADDVLDAGISASMVDIPPMGAALRLGAGREVRRNQTETQGDTRRAAEVPPGAVRSSFATIAGLRQARIQSEALKLLAAYPVRRW